MAPSPAIPNRVLKATKCKGGDDMAARRQAITLIGGSSVDIEDLIDHEAHIEVRVGAGVLNVVYDPHKLNSAHLKEVSDGIPTEDKILDTAVTLVDLVADWDLARGGVKVPLTVDDVARVPWKILNKVMRSIIQDSNAVDPTSARS